MHLDMGEAMQYSGNVIHACLPVDYLDGFGRCNEYLMRIKSFVALNKCNFSFDFLRPVRVPPCLRRV